MTIGMDYTPDPPSVHQNGAARMDGYRTPDPTVLPHTGRPGYVGHRVYTAPPVWQVPSCSSLDVIREQARAAAQDSGMVQIIRHAPGDDEMIHPKPEGR